MQALLHIWHKPFTRIESLPWMKDSSRFSETNPSPGVPGVAQIRVCPAPDSGRRRNGRPSATRARLPQTMRPPLSNHRAADLPHKTASPQEEGPSGRLMSQGTPAASRGPLSRRTSAGTGLSRAACSAVFHTEDGLPNVVRGEVFMQIQANAGIPSFMGVEVPESEVAGSPLAIGQALAEALLEGCSLGGGLPLRRRAPRR